jgi:hypothetical protein
MNEEGELLHQLFLTVSVVSCFVGIDSRHSHTFPTCEEDFGPNDDADEWVGEDEEDIYLEEDTANEE